jgi:hypothetical protein
MKQHKWHKEIKAWADGAEIELRFRDEKWETLNDFLPFNDKDYKFRIKSQIKEKDWVMICKKCGDELGIVYDPK